jgi:hypothetical protein
VLSAFISYLIDLILSEAKNLGSIPETFARQLIEASYGPAHSISAEGAFSNQPGAPPQEFKWLREKR